MVVQAKSRICVQLLCLFVCHFTISLKRTFEHDLPRRKSKRLFVRGVSPTKAIFQLLQQKNRDSNIFFVFLHNILSPGVLSNRALCLCPFGLPFHELNSFIQMGVQHQRRIVNAVLSGCLTSTPCPYRRGV